MCILYEDGVLSAPWGLVCYQGNEHELEYFEHISHFEGATGGAKGEVVSNRGGSQWRSSQQ